MDDILEQNFCEALYRIHVAAADEGRCISNEGIILPETEDGVPIRKLFVSNLAERTTFKDLATLFSKYGNVESCFLRRNQGKSNYAFVTFSNVTDAMRAREDGSRQKIRLHNRDLRVMPSDSWHQPDSIENQYHFTKDWSKSERKLSNEQCAQEYIENDTVETKIHTLNDDCLTHIFLYLPIVDRVRIERVCKRWRAVSQESWCTVKRLDLSHATWGFPAASKRSEIDTATLRKVLLRCGRFLKEINLAQIAHRLSQSTLTVVGNLCPNLQTIDVTALVLSASGINSLTNNCHDIRRLTLGDSTYICDTDLKKLFLVNPKLRYLKMIHTQIFGKCLSCLHMTEEIILEKCNYVLQSHLADAILRLNNLKSLSIKECMGVTSILMTSGQFRYSLQTLELSGYCALMRFEGMFNVTELSNLEVLKVGQNNAVTDEFLHQLTLRCQKLTYIDITGCYAVTNAGLAALATLPDLEYLIMNYLYQVTDSGLQDMINLKHLECRHCNSICDEGISRLIKCAPQLELLDLSGCVGITCHTLEDAADATSYRHNNTVLKIFIGGTAVVLEMFYDIFPFLQIVNVDLSLSDERNPLFS